MGDSALFTFLSSAIINNFVLAMFLGICPFLGVSGKLKTAASMGAATTLVIVMSSVCAYALNALLIHFNLEFLRLISYIVVIASAVQLVEMTMKKFSPALFQALGIYLPLITTNCAVLGVALFQTSREYDLIHSLAFSSGAGAGFTLALVLMAGLREKLELSEIPPVASGTVLTLMLATILSLSFMGFSGLGAH